MKVEQEYLLRDAPVRPSAAQFRRDQLADDRGEIAVDDHRISIEAPLPGLDARCPPAGEGNPLHRLAHMKDHAEQAGEVRHLLRYRIAPADGVKHAVFIFEK